MKVINSIFLFGIFCVLPSFADSFLTAQSFPKTFDDLSFAAKMELKSDDYELYRPEYDNEGFCIKNCAYRGLNIKQEQEKSDNDTKNAIEKSLKYQQEQKSENIKTQNNLSVNTQNILSAVNCENRNTSIPVNQKSPFGEPLVGRPYITSPYGERVLQGKRSFHDGIDYRAVSGTTVYTPADGRVVNVWTDSTCGNGVKIQHEDNTNTIYCHLTKSLVSKNQNVKAGCPIAQTGNTGHSTGPHLHYAIRDSENNKIDASRYTGRGTN
nr:M23 family metallopeptidase [Candidatus Enterousia merdequi]